MKKKDYLTIDEKKKLKIIKSQIIEQEKEISDLNKKSTDAKLISYAISKSLERPKKELSLNNESICNSLLQPIDSLLNKTNIVYNQKYTLNGFLFGDAEILNNYNLEILRILTTNRSKIPHYLKNDYDELTDYLDRWTSAFKKQSSEKKFQKNDDFRVIYSGSTFPVSSAALFKKELEIRCK